MKKQAFKVTYSVAGSKEKKVDYFISATKKNVKEFLSHLTILRIEKCASESWMLNI